MLLIFFLSVVFAFVLYRMTPEERARVFQAVLATIRQLQDAATRGRSRGRAECEPFRDALRARTPWVLVTPTLVALNVVIFVFMLFGAGALSDPATLVRWGANFGPRTTNGEWWRLVTSMFVHSGMLHLLVNVAGLVSIGLILERLVGSLTFAAVYVAAGVFASLVSLSIYPMGVSAGASGAIFGLYGLLLASSIWGLLHRSEVTIPLAAVKRLAPAAVVFILFNLAGDGVGSTAELTGLVAGIVCGLVLARGVSGGKSPARRVAATMAAAIAIAVASAVVLRGVTDVRPEIERVAAVEDHTAGVYRTAVERFRNGRITAAALARMIDETIVPELHAADSRLKSVHGVPQEQQPLVADAEDYFRLRLESWRLRAEGLRKTDMLTPRADARKEPVSNASWRLRAEAQHRTSLLTLGKAEGMERESLEALHRIKSAEPEVMSSKPADQK
jgi:membrane associated rhomboid family serine protease